jgi:hypothetical protein
LRLRPGKESVEVLDFVSDIRRLAEVAILREQVEDEQYESVSVPRNRFEFTDSRLENLLGHWIADVGDLASADESVRLEFPPTAGA